MKKIRYPGRKTWQIILQRPASDTSAIKEAVADVLKDIRLNGDLAVIKYTEKFDKVQLADFRVSDSEFDEAMIDTDSNLKNAIIEAKENVEKFHRMQINEIKKIETTKGVICWQKSVAIEKVGIYIPGGSAPLFSTVLMLGVPAKLAGCREITLCTPPDRNGKINPAILYSAKLIGIDRVFKVGGIQAIGAMAYGTKTIPKVYKIFGPGNKYVTFAKQLISMHEVAIDMPAGPSEVAVIADETSNPAYIASDLLSQAEHGEDSQVILVTTHEPLIKKVLIEINKQVQALPRKVTVLKALANSKLILLSNEDEITDLINEYAPEHLLICTKNYREIAEKIINAGSIFLGSFTPESAGDYASGTNHTLPTYGYAKSYSGVNMDSFVKKITFQEISEEGLKNIGNTIEVMAEAEHLHAHKNAVAIRLKDLKIN